MKACCDHMEGASHSRGTPLPSPCIVNFNSQLLFPIPLAVEHKMTYNGINNKEMIMERVNVIWLRSSQ